jgi:hypothetical protein
VIPKSIVIPHKWDDLHKLFLDFYDPLTTNEERGAWLGEQLGSVLRVRRAVGLRDSHPMWTSGAQTGVSKPFSWGPGFMVFHEFFSRLATATTCTAQDMAAAKNVTLLVGTVTCRSDEPSGALQVMYGDPCSQVFFTNELNVGNRSAMEHIFGQLLEQLDNGMLTLCPALLGVMLEDPGCWLLCFLVDLLKSRGIRLGSTFQALPGTVLSKLTNLGLDVRDHMRCWDGGATFFTCSQGRVHWVDMLAPVWTNSRGELISSDAWNASHEFSSYSNGDLCQFGNYELCSCGLVRRTGEKPVKNTIDPRIEVLTRVIPGVFHLKLTPVTATVYSLCERSNEAVSLVESLYSVSNVVWKSKIKLYRGKLRPQVGTDSGGLSNV